MSNATEAVQFSNIAATTAAFPLRGGRYVMTGVATWSAGNIALQTLAQDGSTWVASQNIAGSANTLTANGQQIMDLPTGTYRIAVTTSTAVYVSVVKVPRE